jgi:acetylornithine deacetylase/succinyl-diaminopimelate desuccinylase-like protein
VFTYLVRRALTLLPILLLMSIIVFALIRMIQGDPIDVIYGGEGHMDVVEPGPEGWQHNPYGGEISQGRLWGRGACDTKGSLAAMLCAAAELPSDDLAGTLVMAATVCEETVTGAALGHVLDAHPAGLVITGEPTGLRLGVAQKGRATLRLHAAGRSDLRHQRLAERRPARHPQLHLRPRHAGPGAHRRRVGGYR